MYNKKWFLVLSFAAVLLVTLACGVSVSTAKIVDASMSKDEQGTQTTTTFVPTDTFYCNVDLQNAPDDTTVKAVWTAVNVEGANANTQINTTDLKSGSGTLHFKLSNANPWPAGSYKVDLYLNDKHDSTVEFQVQ